MNVAIILAAGESRRMGEPKQLLPFGDKTMLECVIAAFASPPIDEILVVLGHKAGEIVAGHKHVAAGFSLRSPRTREGCGYRNPRPRVRFASPRLRFVRNPRYRHGMFTSVQAGLRALPKGAKRVLIALCDQPRLKRRTVERLIAEFKKKRRKILIPVHGGRQGHPLLFAARYVPEILALDGSLTLKHFLANHPDDIARLPVEDEGVLMDIDEPSDYRNAASL